MYTATASTGQAEAALLVLVSSCIYQSEATYFVRLCVFQRNAQRYRMDGFVAMLASAE
jgi:hypothetical protein